MGIKTRFGFVTNSSSTAFIITNDSDKERSLLEFFEDNKDEIMQEARMVWDYDYTDEEIRQSIVSCYPEYGSFKPGESKYCVFGDEHGNPAGHVFDYVLRDIKGKNGWRVRFCEYLR